MNTGITQTSQADTPVASGRHVAFERRLDGERIRIGEVPTWDEATRLAQTAPIRERSLAVVCEEHLVGTSVRALWRAAVGTLGPASFRREERAAVERGSDEVPAAHMWKVCAGRYRLATNRRPGLDILELRAYFVGRHRVHDR
jgi:hypothetical protein